MNNDFLEGFIEECVKLGVPEAQIEPLYKQALMYTKLAEKNASFIEGFKSTMTQNGHMTGAQVDQWSEKSAGLWTEAMEKSAINWGRVMSNTGRAWSKGLRNIGRGIGRAAEKVLYNPTAMTQLGVLGGGAALGAGVLSPSWRSGLLSDLRLDYRGMGRSGRERMQELGQRYGGSEGMAERERILRRLGGDVTTAYDYPEDLDRMTSGLQRSDTLSGMGAIGRYRARQAQQLADMGMGGMGMGMGMNPYSFMYGSAPYYMRPF